MDNEGNMWQAVNDHLDANPYAPTHERDHVRGTIERIKQLTQDNSNN